MKKSYTQRLASQMVTLAKRQATKNVGLLAGLFLVFGLAAFSQTNYYLRTDSLSAKKAQVKIAPSNILAWTTDPNGTAAAGTTPPDFVTDGQIFNIQATGWSNAKNWKVSGAGSKIVVGTDTTSKALTFTSTGSSNIDGIIDVKPLSSFVYAGASTDGITWGTLSTGSTVRFEGSTVGYQKVLPGNYYNLSLATGGATYLSVILPQQTIHVAGLFTPRASAVYGSTIDFNGPGGQYIPAGNYYNLTISGTKAVSDSLQGTIFVAGAFNDISSGSPLVSYTLSKTTGAITASTINYNGLNTAGQSLGNGQSYYNLTFSNGRSFVVTGYNNSNNTITIAQPDGDLAIGDSVSANSTIFPTLNSAVITGITTDTVLTLSAPPALRLIVHTAVPAGSPQVYDTVYIASYNNTATVGDPTDSTLTLTAPVTFAAGDTLYASQILTAPTVTKGVVTNAATLLVASVSGATIQLSSLKAFNVNANPSFLNTTLSIGTPTKLPTPKTVTGTVNIGNTFVPGTGTITTTGSTFNYKNALKQNIAGGKNFVYNNLTINEAADSAATLSASALVQGALNIQHGKLTTTTKNLLTLDVNATITTGSDSSFVNGPLAKNFASTTPFTYPIGAVYQGLGYPRKAIITPGTADAKTYTAAYAIGKVANITKIDSTSLDAIADSAAYYNVAVSNYTAGADTSAQLNFEFIPGYYLDSNLVLAHYFHGKFVAESTPFLNTNGSQVNVTTNGYDTTFGHFTLGIANPTTVPVKLGAVVAAQLANSTVKVSWESYSEINVNKYVVESSADGINFAAKGSLPAKGASGYSFIDNSPKEGLNYYRIKEIDNDGRSSYSTVVSVKIGGSIVGNISIYPNPVTNKQLNFALNTAAANYTLKVTDVLGKSVLASTINHNGGTASYSIALPAGLAKGVYFVKLSNGKNEVTKTIIVQ